MNHSTTPQTIPLWYISVNFGLRLRKTPNSQNVSVLYGERGIVLKKIFLKTTHRLRVMMLLALISSTFLFMVLYYVGEEWLDYYFNSSSYMVNMQKPYLESLQQYIKKNGSVK